MIKKIIILSLVLLVNTTLVYAEYKLLAPLNSQPEQTITPGNFGTYLQSLINISIGITGAVSVIILIIGGLQYIFSSVSESAKKDAKEAITNAVFGILIALSAYLLLKTINPNLIKLGLPKINTLSPPSTTKTPGGGTVKPPTTPNSGNLPPPNTFLPGGPNDAVPI